MLAERLKKLPNDFVVYLPAGGQLRWRFTLAWRPYRDLWRDEGIPSGVWEFGYYAMGTSYKLAETEDVEHAVAELEKQAARLTHQTNAPET